MSISSKFIKHTSCDACGSSDANAVFSDGHTHCYSCNTHTHPKDNKTPQVPVNVAYRGISPATAAKYGVETEVRDGLVTRRIYPYTNVDGHPQGAKIRDCVTKAFTWKEKTDQTVLFGQNLFPAGSAKAITLVEGEEDALAAFQMQGSRFPVVSVHSASSAVKNCANSFEYLNSFEKIVIVFDKDEGKVNPATGNIHYPGQEAAIAVANMFPIGKVRICTLAEHKDPNDYLINNKSAEFSREWWAAPAFTPTGLKIGRNMWEEISAPKNYETAEYPFKGFNELTYGLRLSELVILTADTGLGKTTVLKEIEYHLLRTTNHGLGFLHLEEPNADTALGLMSIAANKPLHLPDVREATPDDELRGYFDSVVNTDRVVIWDHFGSNSIHEVLAKIRHMHNLGCKYIILDHISIVVSDQSGDERKQLDEISTKLKTLCMELNVAVLAVIHQNRAGEIRGSAGPEQVANIVFKLHRNKEDPDPWRRNVTKVVVQKNRFCGKTGPAAYLWYCPETGRLVELAEEEARQYELGITKPKEEQW